MNILKDVDSNELVIRIPLTQKSYDAVDEYIGDVPNVIGVISGNDYSISQLIDLGYKGDQQEGMPLVMFESEEKLRTICRVFNIDVWQHEICAYCKRGIYGSFRIGDKGSQCYNCEQNEKRKN